MSSLTGRSKHFVVAGLIACLLVLTIFLVLWERRRRQSTASDSRQKATPAERIASMPVITLQVNHTSQLTVYQGTPLILMVGIANDRARIAAAQDVSDQVYLAELQGAAARGEASPQRVQAVRARLENKPAIDSIKVGDETASWDSFVHFAQQLPDGTQQSLPWTVTLSAAPKGKSLTLDAKNDAEVDYLLAPSAASQLAVGEYQIRAVMEVSAEARLSEDHWRGRVASEPVRLTVLEKPAHLIAAEEQEWNLDFARYYQKTNDPAQALKQAQKVLAANPRSIPAHILIGEVKEGQGDLRGALEAYQIAEADFYEQYPNSYEAPLYLVYKASDLLGRLRQSQ